MKTASPKWSRRRAAKPAPARRKGAKPVRARAAGAPAFVEPMKALAVSEVPAGDWRLEIKYDGFRALALVDHGSAELWSRNRKPWVDRFAPIRAALERLRCEDAILDGEIVSLDEQGRPSFQRLQNEGHDDPARLRYYVFDLLRLNGRSYLEDPLEERQAAVVRLLAKAPAILAVSPVFDQSPKDLLAAARKQGLEGIIAKAAGSPYEPGRRSGTWLKCRIAHDQEFVIGGFTPPKGARPYFGALLVGYYADGPLMYAGKVGTGFDTKKLAALSAKFASLRADRCPFANLPADRRSRFGQGMTAAAMREVTWLKPSLVAQIKFAEWTNEGALRQPVFLGLRTDKAAKEVVREATAAGD